MVQVTYFTENQIGIFEKFNKLLFAVDLPQKSKHRKCFSED